MIQRSASRQRVPYGMMSPSAMRRESLFGPQLSARRENAPRGAAAGSVCEKKDSGEEDTVVFLLTIPEMLIESLDGS